MRIRIRTAASGGEIIHGRCITIGEGGFGAILTQELPVKEPVWVEFRAPELPEDRPIRAEIRQCRGFQYGFQFVSPDSRDKALIRRLFSQGTSTD